MNSDLQLVTSREFNGVTLNCYQEAGQVDPNDFWATRDQIGQLLEYENPNDAVRFIHTRHQERLDTFSTSFKLNGVEGSRTVTREVIMYSFKGLLEICRYSNQPKADAVMDLLWDIADEIRRTGSYSLKKDNPALPSGVIEGARAIFETAGITGNQAALALDRLYRSYTGRSALETGGIELIAPTKRQNLTPSNIGDHFNLSSRRVNEILAVAGYQHKINGMWEPLSPGMKYAVMIDVGKRHSKGTAIRQLKWDSSILDVFGQLMKENTDNSEE